MSIIPTSYLDMGAHTHIYLTYVLCLGGLALFVLFVPTF